jgi:uncharacterized protein YkwD
LNNFRKNPKELAKKLELIRTYLDPDSNILSEPNKVQIQMVEGDAVFKEAIQFLKSLPPLPPLAWDQNLATSAQEHVNDIGPKGLLLYQSSDGTEPEERIAKYGNYTEPLGENIDFGPNDAMGVIVSLTLDDGEEQRPHRENLFKDDFKKVGIACGPHETEFQMCVMDFAFDFQPLNNQRKNMRQEDMNMQKMQMNREEEMMNNLNMANQDEEKNINNQSPVVKLSIDKEEMKNNLNLQRQNNEENMNNVNQPLIQEKPKDEIGNVISDTINRLNNTKVIKKKVEIVTTITYTYEDGSTKVITQNQTHEFNN